MSTPFLGSLSGEFLNFPMDKTLIGYKLTLTDATKYLEVPLAVLSADDVMALFESSDPISVVKIRNENTSGYCMLSLGTDRDEFHSYLVVYPSGAAASLADELHLINNYGGLGLLTGSSGTSYERLTIDSSGYVGLSETAPGDYYSKDLVVSCGDEGGVTLVGSATHAQWINFADGKTGTDRYSGFIGYDHNINFMSFGTSGTVKMVIDSTGDIGLGGITSPSSYVGDAVVVGIPDDGGITIVNDVDERGWISFADGTTGDEQYRGYVTYDHDGDLMYFGTAGTLSMSLDSTGDLDVVGALSKGSGSFKIDHPLPEKKDTHHLIHSFIEGPKADLIYRGKVQLTGGSASINIDEIAGMTDGTFILLCDDVQCFTSNETDWDAVKGFVSGNILSIDCQNTSSTALVSWLVIGERKDDHMKETGWTDENGRPIIEPLKPETTYKPREKV